VQALVKLHLGADAVVSAHTGGWAVMFDAPSDANLDFLRPHLLPPR